MLGKLSPEERAEFLEMLHKRAAARGVKSPGTVASDPKDLGKLLTSRACLCAIVARVFPWRAISRVPSIHHGWTEPVWPRCALEKAEFDQ